MKLCKDCRWFEPRRIYSVLWTEDKCTHEKAVFHTRINYVSGKTRVFNYTPEKMRGTMQLCGHPGNYFEPKGKTK